MIQEEITILHPNGFTRVQAVKYRYFAVHASAGCGRKGWTVTHMPSGMAVREEIEQRKEALSMAENLDKLFVTEETMDFVITHGCGISLGGLIKIRDRENLVIFREIFEILVEDTIEHLVAEKGYDRQVFSEVEQRWWDSRSW